MSNTIPPGTLFTSASSKSFTLTLQRTLWISSPNLSCKGTLSTSGTTWASASQVQCEEERGCGLIQSNTSIFYISPLLYPISPFHSFFSIGTSLSEHSWTRPSYNLYTSSLKEEHSLLFACPFSDFSFLISLCLILSL